MPRLFRAARRREPGVDRRKDFLYVGRLAPEKGIDLMLDAFRTGKHTLRIIGEGPKRPDHDIWGNDVG